MNERELAEAAKRKNIFDMALTFTAMMRLFTEGPGVKRAGVVAAVIRGVY